MSTEKPNPQSPNKATSPRIIKENKLSPGGKSVIDSLLTDNPAKKKGDWIVNTRKKLIEFRNEEGIIENFTIAKNDGFVKKKLWNRIADDLNIGVNGEEVSKKYKYLLSQYRKVIDQRKTSGEGKVSWLYADTFDKVLGGKAFNDPESKWEIGGDELILEDNSNKAEKEVEKEVYRDCPSKKSKKVRDMEYQDMKMKVMAKLLDTDKSENIDEVKALEEKLGKRINTMDAKLDQIFDAIGKINK